MTGENRIVLVDGYAQIYRSFYAIRGLANAEGEPTNALFGMARFILNLDEALPHAFGAVVLDKGKSAKRTAVLPEYKATRPPMPDDLRSQLPKIRRWIECCGWTLIEQDGVEADDLIAAIAGVREGRELAIVSSDKDLAQLIEPGVAVVQTGKKGTIIRLDRQGVIEKFGVPPEYVRDYLALTGDSVDNIKGVPGVGPKTAAALLNEIGDLDVILANPEAVPKQALREKLVASADLLRRNRELVALDTELPDSWSGMETIRRRRPAWQALLEMAEENGFRSLTSILRKKLAADRSPLLFDLS